MMIQQVIGAEKKTKTNRDMEVPNTEGLLPARIDGGDAQQGGGEGRQPSDGPG